MTAAWLARQSKDCAEKTKKKKKTTLRAGTTSRARSLARSRRAATPCAFLHLRRLRSSALPFWCLAEGIPPLFIRPIAGTAGLRGGSGILEGIGDGCGRLFFFSLLHRLGVFFFPSKYLFGRLFIFILEIITRLDAFSSQMHWLSSDNALK